MIRRARALVQQSLLILVSVASSAAAQGAVTVTGHVSAASMPVRGATVRIESLNLGATTNAEGRFSFIVPSARALGQTVPLTASHPRYRSKSINVVLIGGSIQQDFDLSAPVAETAPRVDQPRVTDTGASNPPTVVVAPDVAVTRLGSRVGFAPFATPVIDSTALIDLAGPVDFAAALAGRFAALDVRSASTLGGTSSMVVRGPRTVSGLTEPLLVINGIVFDNSNITNLAQQSGLGGFDYGTAANDLNVEDIASVQLLTGALAAMRYGGRAANGVLLITTRSARGLHGLEVSASQSYSNASILRLPEYQNAYGQGLGGKFAFFDGKGGGVNDTTSQSWGPALDGSIVLQASYTEAARNAARAFVAVPDNVESYFQGGRTLGTNVALQNGGERGQFRASFSNRSSNGITPLSNVGYRSGLFTGSARPTDKLSVSADLQAYNDHATDRAGTGFDESNPVAGFALLPRQINVPAYRIQLRDLTQAQLSWNYSGRNNPFWAALVNDNNDSRTRYVVGGAASYALSDELTASVRASSDHASQDRSFTVAAGWMGGFPYYLGRGDFSRGGFQTDAITTTLRDVEASLRFAPQSTGMVQTAFTIGADHHSDLLETVTRAKADLTDTTAVKDVAWSGSSSTNVLFARAESRIDNRASVAVSVRSESSALMGGSSVSTVYPALEASFDLLRADSTGSRNGILNSLTLHGGFARSGNEGTGALLQRLGVSTATSAALVSDAAAPEVTTGVDGGASMQMMGGRLGLDLDVYHDRSENLIVPSGIGFGRTASLTNRGIEATATLAPFEGPGGMTWSFGATFGRNANQVESLSGSSTAGIPLGTPFGTASIEAVAGSPVGAIVGNSYLRSADGQLILRDGLPLADSVAGRHVIGQSAPSWIGGLATSVRIRAVEFSVLFDTRRGGQVFSASNMQGAYAGNLAETAFRPDSGLLIAGLDAVTGKSNTVHVSTESYYHALGAITERWVYDAGFVKLREARMSFTLPLSFIDLLRVQSLRASIIGRNLALWTNAPNIDPETVLSASTFRGAEMGQLPTTKSIGFQLSLTP